FHLLADALHGAGPRLPHIRTVARNTARRAETYRAEGAAALDAAEAAGRRAEQRLADHDSLLRRVEAAAAVLADLTPDEPPLLDRRAAERAWQQRPSTLDGEALSLLEPFADAQVLFAGGWLHGRLPVPGPSDAVSRDDPRPAAIEELTGARYQTLVAAASPMDGAERTAAVETAVESVVRAVNEGGYASLVFDLAGGERTLVAVVRDAIGVRFVDPPREPAGSLDELLGSGFAGLVRHVEALAVDRRGTPVPVPGAPRGLHSRHPVPEAYDAALPELDRAAARVERLAAGLAGEADLLRRARQAADAERAGELG
ncbi:hypothetical protein, partial [Micromonospora sp. CPCC 206061]|uniref:hypothetical protein n=1 Tax=Micromonospora sp. CPCC 206061 TaxID=3122410 RepID=UPI003B623F78